MPVVFRQAELALDFLVVGGGVGGLATAYMLGRAGHRVKVFDKDNYSAPGGGHRVPPNLSKILREWVGEEELRTLSTRCVGSPMHDLYTLHPVGYLRWEPAVMAETGGEFLLMHHDDLVQLLHRLAVKAGAEVVLNTKVASVEAGTNSSPCPKITLEDGRVLSADMVIGADGRGSMVRRTMFAEVGSLPSLGVLLYTGLVKAEEMHDDPEIASLMRDEWTVWFGNNKCLSGHPVRERTEYSFFMHIRENSDQGHCRGEITLEEITHDIPPKLKGMMAKAFKTVLTPWIHLPEDIQDWADASGRIVLLGDAAHPPCPCGTHTASMAIEDAVVFGSLFSHLSATDQIPTFVSAYQELRQHRCSVVRADDVENIRLLTLPPGPEVNNRNKNLSIHGQEWNEGLLRLRFEQLQEVFGYDAGDAAEEWWINWGRFQQYWTRSNSQ